MQPTLTEKLKQRAHELGFDLVGVTDAVPSVFAEPYRQWLADGCAGEMDYLNRSLDRRFDPREILPGARSIVSVGMNYYTESEPAGPHDAVFARYARGGDYHDVMTPRLRLLLEYLQAEAGPDTIGRVYVDTGPVLEREVAWRAGLGWFGKNTMLINTKRGSYFLLGELITNVALRPDMPADGGCGTCTRCIDACPTGAITEPYRVDARRCISYLTIELKGAIPPELVPHIGAAGNRVFGCDICQEVCPFCIKRSVPTGEPAFQPRDVTINSMVSDVLYLTEQEFRVKFKASPVKRAKRRGLLRNAAMAVASRDDENATAALEHALNDPEELVRASAASSLQVIRMRTSE
jgi:epoxyqueuosine reductase